VLDRDEHMTALWAVVPVALFWLRLLDYVRGGML
jgi:hypothetical protein